MTHLLQSSTEISDISVST